MSSWRALGSLAIVLLVGVQARAQTFELSEAPLVDSCFRIDIGMSLDGEIKVRQDGQTLTIKQSARARHQFLERILKANPAGLGDRAIRYYQSADARITVDKDESTRHFRPERVRMVAQRVGDQTRTYCPKGPLTRDEVELTEHFDSLALPGLLPRTKVKIGATWNISNATVQNLCDLGGLIDHDLSGKLDKVQDGVAYITITGHVNGIAQGAAVKLDIAATGEVDLKEHRLVALTWKQKDQREQGPVSPAFVADVVTQIKRVPIEQPTELNDLVLALVPTSELPPDAMTQLVARDPKGGFELVHARDWYLVGQTDRQMIMRLMDRGDFVAQLTITTWKKAEAGKHLSEEEFKEAMGQAPGWEQEKLLDNGTRLEDSRHHYWIYRVGATGALNGVKAIQYFYLVAGPHGDQLVLTFTMTPAQVQKLGTRDVELVRGLTFLDAKN
jgi:hypothetical protein